MSTNLGGAPFDLTFRLPIIATGLIADIIVNSFYKMAKRKDRLKLWITLGNAFRWRIDLFIGLVIFNFYSSVYIIALYLSFYFLLTPLVIAEGAITGYIGYKIYNRVKNLIERGCAIIFSDMWDRNRCFHPYMPLSL